MNAICGDINDFLCVIFVCQPKTQIHCISCINLFLLQYLLFAVLFLRGKQKLDLKNKSCFEIIILLGVILAFDSHEISHQEKKFEELFFVSSIMEFLMKRRVRTQFPYGLRQLFIKRSSKLGHLGVLKKTKSYGIFKANLEPIKTTFSQRMSENEEGCNSAIKGMLKKRRINEEKNKR